MVNRLALVVVELKSPADENVTVWSAFHQLRTYIAELPSPFACDAVIAVSHDMQARPGTLSAGREWFKPWRTIGQAPAPAAYTELQVAIEGVFEKRLFLSLLRDFIVFEDDSGALVKKMAGYHEFHAVEAAAGETRRVASLQQEAQRVAATGGRYEAGGVVFTAIQEFFPEEKGDRHLLLSDRRNIVVIADEAHRSQYDFLDGYASHMRDALPNASFIGFTGTPIELQDANTRAVFGDYISVYDIERAVEYRATVPSYYESRLAKLTLDEREWPKVMLRPTHPSDREIVWSCDFGQCHRPPRSACGWRRISRRQSRGGSGYPRGLPNARIRLAFSSCAARLLKSIPSEPARLVHWLRFGTRWSDRGGSPRGAAVVSDRVVLGAGDEMGTHRSVGGALGATPRDRVGAMDGWSPFLGLSPGGGV